VSGCAHEISVGGPSLPSLEEIAVAVSSQGRVVDSVPFQERLPASRLPGRARMRSKFL
jgi:hypothetical protein